jgi:hypothetical protein
MSFAVSRHFITKCIGTKVTTVSSDGLRKFAVKIGRYRNLIHEDIVVLLIDETSKKRYIPLADKLDKYARWSSLRTPDWKDFTELDYFIVSSVKTISELIDGGWRSMLTLSSEILNSAEYRRLLPPLQQPTPAVPTVLTSNTQEAPSNIITELNFRPM